MFLFHFYILYIWKLWITIMNYIVSQMSQNEAVLQNQNSVENTNQH